jgi:hypothetical protein
MLRQWRTWVKPSYLPLAIGASVLVISWFYLIWNTTLGELLPSVRFRTKATIAGIVQDAAPMFSLDRVLTGAYQHWISSSVGKLSPVFKPAVFWKNQLYYTMFGTAGSDSVVVGKGQQLFEKTYLEEYCGRDLAVLRLKGERSAKRVRRMQDYFDSRGKSFFYIITPSKAAQLPQFLPDRYTCPARIEDRTQKLAVYGEILMRHGVRFVDAASDLATARHEYGIEMFPRGGIHWNSLASAIGTLKIIGAVNAQPLGPRLTTFSFTWKISYNLQAIDRDLLDIMNLPYPDLHYPVPELTLQSEPLPSGCHTVKIAEVGGSFLGSINDTMGKLACPPDITFWSYWDHRGMRYADKRWRELPMDAELRSQSLLRADMIFLEENDALAPDSEHSRLMARAIEEISNTRLLGPNSAR